uniref:Large Terminase n=1 Tax=Siphoviridae sp. ctGpg14 TaxID=2827824 RepID=A0A8S5T616_9CAUD|nr:MAG TPA: Large Terminase [Siphoviridae sp. ctGpg14]
MLSNTMVPKYYGEFRDSVLRGETRVCENISLQMNRIDDDIANPDYFYDPNAIDGYVRFCEAELTLTDGTDLTLLPTFKMWAEDLLSWYYYSEEDTIDPATGRRITVRKKRRLRNKQYLIIARGNSKSLYETTIQAYGLLTDTKTTQQITTAPTMAQAEEVMMPFSTAIAKSRGPLFSVLTDGSNKSRSQYTQAKLASTKKGIENKITNSYVEIRPMRIDKLQGSRAKYCTVDEWLSGDVKEDVIGALEQSAAKGGVDDYIILAVSSEGTVRDSVGDSIKMELLKILRGEYEDPHTSIWYYRLDDLNEVNDPSAWIKASPNIGVTVSYDAYMRDVKRAEANPATRNDILAKRFGIPVEGYTYFFTYDEIQKHAYQNYDKLPCSMGMDASQGDDFWAFTWVFPLGGERFGIKTRSYVSESKYRKLPSATRYKYDELQQEGTLVIMPGSLLGWVAVYEDVRDYIHEHDWAVLSFGFDPYNAGAFVDRWCMENGEYGVETVRQGVKTESVPLGEIKALAEARMLIFDEELMKFAMGNSVALQDNNGNYKLDKRRSDEKIDNVAALMDAWVAMTRNREMFM